MAVVDEIAPDLFRISRLRAAARPPVQPLPGARTRSRCCSTPACGHVPGGARGGRRADRPGGAALDRLEPLRVGRMRRAQRVAGRRAEGTGGLQPCRARSSTSTTSPSGPPRPRPDDVLVPAATGSATTPRPICPTGGMPECCSRSTNACCSARTSSTRTGTWSRSPTTTSSVGRGRGRCDVQEAAPADGLRAVHGADETAACTSWPRSSRSCSRPCMDPRLSGMARPRRCAPRPTCWSDCLVRRSRSVDSRQRRQSVDHRAGGWVPSPG